MNHDDEIIRNRIDDLLEEDLTRQFHRKQLVIYRHVPANDFGYIIDIPALVVRVNMKTVTIDAIRSDGSIKRISVNPKRLTIDSADSFDIIKPVERDKKSLIWNEVVTIRQRLTNGERGVDIAEDYNVSASLISRIRHANRWNATRQTSVEEGTA